MQKGEMYGLNMQVTSFRKLLILEGWGGSVTKQQCLKINVSLAYQNESTILFMGLFLGLSLTSRRGGGQGFPPTMRNVIPSYFHTKIEEKLNL